MGESCGSRAWSARMRTRPVPTRVSVAMASARARGRVKKGPDRRYHGPLQIAFEAGVPPLHRALGVRQVRAREATVPDGVLDALGRCVLGDDASAEARLGDALEREDASDHEESNSEDGDAHLWVSLRGRPRETGA